MKVEWDIQVGGDGLYTQRKGHVRITSVTTRPCMQIDDEFNRLYAVFNPVKWCINDYGLIYTDDTWLNEFCCNLKDLGFSQAAIDTVDYSEQGAQSDDYIDMDVSQPFIKEAFELGLAEQLKAQQ